MPNPSIAVFSGSQAFLYNDDWWTTQDAGRLLGNEALAASTFPLVFGSLDAGVSTAVSHGSYTAQSLPSDGKGGIVLTEVYENEQDFITSAPVLTNVSGRALVGGAAATLTAGFVVVDGPRTLLIRGAGTLARRIWDLWCPARPLAGRLQRLHGNCD
jgi:hypothetical protein